MSINAAHSGPSLHHVRFTFAQFICSQNMEVCCSFKSIVGGACGPDSRDREQDVQVIPLMSCVKDISKHLTSYLFSGPENELDLILCLANIFTKPDNVD
jgi:hypothetical protein